MRVRDAEVNMNATTATMEVHEPPMITSSVEFIPREEIIVNGERIEVPSWPTCLTCRSPYRMTIEAMRAYGSSYRTIMESLPEHAIIRRSHDGAGLVSVKHFSNRVSAHMTRHCAFDKAVTTRLVDHYAERAGLDVTDAVDTLLTIPAVLASIMQRGHENLVNGAPVSVRDSIAAAKALAEFEDKHGTSAVGITYFGSVIDAVFTVARDLMEPQDFRWFMRQCQENEVVREGLELLHQQRASAMPTCPSYGASG
ncbi:MAG: hypothetical protein JO291_12060 [Acidimicrobiia bacterium]|nr:hypothetical protein [Acidimicrobiia bacterium]